MSAPDDPPPHSRDPDRRPARPPVTLLVPRGYATAAAWTWRGLILVAGIWVALRVFERLEVVALACTAALLFVALGRPLVAFLERRGLPSALAALLSGLVVLVVIGGVGYIVVTRAIEQAPTVISQFSSAIRRLPITNNTVSNWRQQALTYLSDHRGALTSHAFSTVHTVADVAGGLVLTLFVTLYLAYDGRRISDALIRLARPERRPRVRAAGISMWRALSGWVRGTFFIAIFHGVVVGVFLMIIGVPLAVSLALLVFIGSFIPIIGAFLFGGIAVLVTFATQGLVPAAVLVGVLVLDNQIESHLLQPFLVGRYVKLHPLVVVLVIAVGSLLEGVAGALIAVPLAAVVHAAVATWRDPGAAVGPAAVGPGSDASGGPPLTLPDESADRGTRRPQGASRG